MPAVAVAPIAAVVAPAPVIVPSVIIPATVAAPALVTVTIPIAPAVLRGCVAARVGRPGAGATDGIARNTASALGRLRRLRRLRGRWRDRRVHTSPAGPVPSLTALPAIPLLAFERSRFARLFLIRLGAFDTVTFARLGQRGRGLRKEHHGQGRHRNFHRLLNPCWTVLIGPLAPWFAECPPAV